MTARQPPIMPENASGDISAADSTLSAGLQGQGSGFMDTLLASRRRWKSLAQLVADLVFETDEDGTFTFLENSGALGWSGQELLGTKCGQLLPFPETAPGPNPFRTDTVMRGRRCWIRRADGSFACLLIYAMPLRSISGTIAGARGLGIDISSEVSLSTDMAVSQLHSEIIRRISVTLRSRPMPRLGIPPAFEELCALLGASGGVLVAAGNPADEHPEDKAPPEAQQTISVLHRLPHESSDFGDAIEAELLQSSKPAFTSPALSCQSGRDVIQCSSHVRYAQAATMILWRDNEHVWSQDDANLAEAALTSFAAALEMDALHRTMSRNACFDPLTGLLNRRGFITEVARRLPRLDREHLHGAILMIGIDRFADINTHHGFETGDRALQQIARELRDAIRPTDLVGRLGGDIFGLWLDGADQFVAAERAEAFCQNGVLFTREEPMKLPLSVGLASRAWNSGEAVDSLIERASVALRSVKLAGGARWHASVEESAP